MYFGNRFTLTTPTFLCTFYKKINREFTMKRDEVIKTLIELLSDETGDLGYDGYIEHSETGNSFKLVIIPSPGRHTVPRQSVIDSVLHVVKSHFPSECVTTMEGTRDYPYGSYIITVSDYTRFHK